MTKRLQVTLKDSEYRQIQRAARARRMSIAEWVRQALAHARRREAVGDVEKKLAAIRRAVKYEFPAVDIETCSPRLSAATEPTPALILIDSNIPMHLPGPEHARKIDAQHHVGRPLAIT